MALCCCTNLFSAESNKLADHLIYEFLQWNQLFGIHKIESLHIHSAMVRMQSYRAQVLHVSECQGYLLRVANLLKL